MQTKRILVAYTTESGSTTDVAQAIGEELGKDGAQVDVRRFGEVGNLDAYEAVVVGAPMILGWHKDAMKFVKVNQKVLSQKPVAYFFTAMSLTQLGEKQVGDVPVWVDQEAAVPPQKAGRLSLKERYATLANYLNPVLKAAPSIKPVSAGFFGGKLELFRLKLLAMLFVMIIIQAKPGDLRDFSNIRGWAGSIRPLLLNGKPA